MKEKKVKNIQSIYIPTESQEIVEELDKIRWREHKSMSDIFLIAAKEYVQRHKDGNEQMRLDSPELEAIPQFHANSGIIHGHMSKRLGNEEDEYKYKIQEWKHAFKERFGYEP